MSFGNEKANKLSHNRILSNPKISDSLQKYRIIFDASAESEDIVENLINISAKDHDLGSVFSVDGGFDKVPVNNKFPSAEVGFIQFSLNLVKLNVKVEMVKNGLVNPVEFNRITEAHTHSLDLPIYNTILSDYDNITDSIRYKINDYFSNARTYSEKSFTLLDTLYEILTDEDLIKNFNCISENCKKEYFSRIRVEEDLSASETKNKLITKKNFTNEEKSCSCPNCGMKLYIIDYLRLHELVVEDFGAGGILSRLCKVVEQLYPLNLIMGILSDSKIKEEHKYKTLSKIAFIVDGPLAIFGEPAKINRSIHRYLTRVNNELKLRNLDPLVYFGLTKTGTIVDHISLLLEYIKENSTEKDDKFLLPKNKLMLIDDNYRFKYIQPKIGNALFGTETYYGQDMVYFNRNSQPYVINVLYPIGRDGRQFREIIFNHESYTNLQRIVNLIEELEVDVYDNALLPIVLAHKYASISLQPGVSSLEDFARSIIE